MTRVKLQNALGSMFRIGVIILDGQNPLWIITDVMLDIPLMTVS